MCSDAIKLLYGMVIPYGGKVWWEESLANWLVSSIWQKKVWRINRSANRLLIISTNLDDFSLANHGQFAKYTDVSPSQSFPPYSTWYNIFSAWFLDIRISTLNVLVTHQFIYQFYPAKISHAQHIIGLLYKVTTPPYHPVVFWWYSVWVYPYMTS